MKIIRRKKDLNKLINKINSFSFVPTMGGLHKGHESLIKKAKKINKNVLVSIFVNPKQFNSKNDYKTYTRNLRKDIKILKKLKTKITIILVEHDMDVVFSLADKITVLVYGKIIATDRPDIIRNIPEVQAAYLGE